jgi:hypothetical protein
VDANSSFTVERPGQPLFLHYLPDPLIRGSPADRLTWVAWDQYEQRGTSAAVNIHIQCSPGYFYDLAAPEMCAPCGPGSFNLPELMDQVRRPPPPPSRFVKLLLLIE